MTRLFLRFYLGVLVTALVTFVAVSALLLESTRAHDERVVEDSLHGGATLLRESLRDLPPASRAAKLEELSKVFHHELSVVSWRSTRVPLEAQVRASGVRDIAFFADEGGASYVAVPLVKNESLLLLGPLPDFALPSTVPMLASLALIMLVSGVFLVLAFRPLRQQLDSFEHTAERLARGDFSARVADVGPSSLPLARALDRMAEETERLVRGQRELFHMVSHELRTPLARLRFALALLGDEPNAALRTGKLHDIESDLDGLEALVDELLTYARLEHGAPQLNLQRISVGAVLGELQREAANGERPLSLCRPSSELHIEADERLFRRAIRNLVDNALRHAKASVALSWELHDTFVRIHVDDDGPGIDVVDRDRAFVPFVRLRDEGTGTGLGLAIVRRVVEWHGGRVHIEDSPSGGTRVTSEWPTGDR